jgi:hypothetical protein
MTIPLRLLAEILEAVRLALNEVKAGNQSAARPYVDRIRQLRSFMADHIHGSDQVERHEAESYSSIALEAAQVVNNGLAALELISNSIDLPKCLVHDNDFHRFLDKNIPPIWDWEVDVFIFLEIPHSKWFNVLQERGQKRVLCVLDDANSRFDFPEGWLLVNNVSDIDKVIQQWHPNFPKRHAIFELNYDTSCKVEPHKQAVIDALVRENVNENTVMEFSKLWVKQQYRNAKKAVVSRGISDLKLRICDRNVIIVSPGPSLSKNIEILRVNAEKFVIIAVAQACPALVKHNISPDFVVIIDPIDYSEVLSGFDCSKSALIIDDRCSPAFFNKDFSEIFILSSHFFSFCGISQVTKEECYVAKGGSVSVIAFGLVSELGAKSITLIGQDLSVEGGFYYHRPGSDSKPVFVEDDNIVLEDTKKHHVYKLPGYFGGEVRTKPDFWLFHFQLEKVAFEVSGNVDIFNATEGGAYISGFVHKPLTEVVAEMEYILADCVPVQSLSINEKKIRVCKLLKIHQEHIKSCDKIDIFCCDILRLLMEDSRYMKNSSKIDSLEKLIGAETSKLPMLSGILQGELKYFDSRLRQCTDLSDNLSLSRSLYAQIKSATAEYRDIVLSGK